MIILSTAVQAKSVQADKPNILFIFADDLSYKTTGFTGHLLVKSPNIDKIAQAGVVFDHTYNMGSWTPAVCAASRNMLNTGKTLWRANSLDAKMNNVFTPKVQSEIVNSMWAKRMAAAGYDTYMSGKWHVKAQLDNVFDDVGTERAGMPQQQDIRYKRSFDAKGDNWSPYDKSMGGYWQGGKHWSEVLATEAIDYLDKKSDSQKPFFMYLAFNAPHDPRQAPKEYIDMYPLEQISLPDSYQAKHESIETMGLIESHWFKKDNLLRDERLGPYPRTEYSTKVNRQEYYALISHMDSQIGRIMARLKENGQLENTIIIFTADHGLAIGEHGLLGKQNMYEHSLRTPFVISGPNIPSGEVRNTPIYLQDAMATALDIAGANNNGVEFKSVLPLITNTKMSHYDSIYGAYLDNQRAVIVNDFKLILYPLNGGVIELYDLSKDPQELNNLADKPEMKNKMKALFKELLDLQEKYDDKLELTGVYPNLM